MFSSGDGLGQKTDPKLGRTRWLQHDYRARLRQLTVFETGGPRADINQSGGL